MIGHKYAHRKSGAFLLDMSIYSQDTQCPYAFVEVETKMTMFKMQTNDKTNLRITANQTLTKILKFQKDLDKIVGGVAFTRLDTISDEQSDT